MQNEKICCKLLRTSGENYVPGSSWWEECKLFSLILYCESVPSLRSGPVQKQVVNTEAVVVGTVLDLEEDDEEEYL